MQEPIVVHAFWGYDKFPCLLGGTVTQTRLADNGDNLILAKEYDRWFKPKFFLLGEAGAKLRIELKQIEGEMRNAERELGLAFKKKRDALILKYGGKID